MTAARPKPRHPSAAVMIRRLDGELEPRLERRLGRHLERCGPCHARWTHLEARSHLASRAIADAVASTPVPELPRRAARNALLAAESRARSRRWRGGGWVAAASVAGLLVLSWTVGPLRAWVWERGSVSESAVVIEPAALPAAVVGAEGSIVAFDAAGEIFSVQLEERPASGELLLQVLPIGRATAQVTGTGGESILVLPSGVRIENDAASTASYRVTLPPTVAEVIVRIGEVEERHEVDGGTILRVDF